ncbi:MAG: hypothetical protein FJX57_04825, partial [Alphaproteobacteria bacterium]|nr:hypothetical protein [Alphaproteobacteria bacterium]
MLSLRGFLRARPAEVEAEWRDEKALGARARSRLMAAFREEERRGLLIAALTRSAITAAITAWLWSSPTGGRIYDLAIGGVFLVLGLVQIETYRRARTLGWSPFVFATIDAIILGLVVAIPNPVAAVPSPPAIGVREAGLVNAFLLLVQVAFSFRPGLVIWMGGVLVAVAIAALAWIGRQPGMVVDPGWWHAPAWQSMPGHYFDPMY